MELEDVTVFDRIMIQEPVQFGQRISEFTIECYSDDQWIQIAAGTTIGYKRLLRITPVRTKQIRLLIKKSNNAPAISNFGLYKSSDLESLMLQ